MVDRSGPHNSENNSSYLSANETAAQTPDVSMERSNNYSHLFPVHLYLNRQQNNARQNQQEN